MANINKLLDVMAKLRDPQSGCPWDVAQDFHTISPYTVEEAYEVADAIAREDMVDLRDWNVDYAPAANLSEMPAPATQ